MTSRFRFVYGNVGSLLDFERVGLFFAACQEGVMGSEFSACGIG